MILAFVHIEKTAGTTLNQILRRNFFLKFIDVRPLSKRSKNLFTASDLRMYLIINPHLKAISGHAIRPFVASTDEMPEIRYMTILRDPTRRYISQYLYFVRIKEREDDFTRYLDQEEFTNYQTKKLVGSENAEAAVSVLNRMLEVGVVEEFDTFLLRLKRSLKPIHFDPRHTNKNAGEGTSDRVKRLLDRYGAEIATRNRKDQQLYDHTVKHIIPRHNESYGSGLKSDLALFQMKNAEFRTGFRDYIDYAVRKLYYQAVSGTLRRMNGLPAAGSY